MEISAPRCALMCYPSSNITYCIACLLCIGVILLNKFNSIQVHTEPMFLKQTKIKFLVLSVYFSNLFMSCDEIKL